MHIQSPDDENGQNPDSIDLSNRIYFNSFELPSDTIEWYGGVVLYNEAPETGGSRSLYVSGGCLVPHV